MKQSKWELGLIKYIKTNKKYTKQEKEILLRHVDKVYIWPSKTRDGFSCTLCPNDASRWLEPDDYDLEGMLNHLSMNH